MICHVEKQWTVFDWTVKNQDLEVKRKKRSYLFQAFYELIKKTVTSQVHLKIKGDYDLSRGKTIDNIWYQDLEPEVIFCYCFFTSFFLSKQFR